jgi:hypothetical protein
MVRVKKQCSLAATGIENYCRRLQKAARYGPIGVKPMRAMATGWEMTGSGALALKEL